jgi:uncharacterized membrane protein
VDSLLDSLLVFVTRRWYVVAFLVTYIVLGLTHLGARRLALFSAVAAAISWMSEFPSIRWGFPYGLYHYLWGPPSGLDPREPSIFGVPCFSTLSYVFLNYASYCAAVVVLGAGEPRGGRARAAMALVSAALVVAVDTIIDPVALRGDRWFLGKMYHYPHGGEHWGIPITNYAGWLLVGALIVGTYLALEARLATPRPVRPAGPPLGTALYFAVIAFNVVVTFWIGERDLAWSSVAIAAPLLAIVLARGFLTVSEERPTIPRQEGLSA